MEAIIEAENHTSGEIRVHLERGLDKDPIRRAEEVFYYLGMDGTRNQNGILFYVAVDDHRFAVIGDKGIDQVVDFLGRQGGNDELDRLRMIDGQCFQDEGGGYLVGAALLGEPIGSQKDGPHLDRKLLPVIPFQQRFSPVCAFH